MLNPFVIFHIFQVTMSSDEKCAKIYIGNNTSVAYIERRLILHFRCSIPGIFWLKFLRSIFNWWEKFIRFWFRSLSISIHSTYLIVTIIRNWYSSIQWGLGPTKISKTFSRPNSLKKVTFQTCELAFTPISLNLEQKNWCILFVIMDWIPHKFQFVHWFFTELMKVIWINRCEFCEWKSHRQKKNSEVCSAFFVHRKRWVY